MGLLLISDLLPPPSCSNAKRLDRYQSPAKLVGIDPIFPVIEEHIAIGLDEPSRLVEKAGRDFTCHNRAVGNRNRCGFAPRID